DEISIILAMEVGVDPLLARPEGTFVEIVSRNMRMFNGNYECKLLLGAYGYELLKDEAFGFRFQDVVWVDADGAPTLFNVQPQFAFRILPDRSANQPAALSASHSDAEPGLLQPAPRPQAAE